MPKLSILPIAFFILLIGCHSPESSQKIPKIGFLDAFQDETIFEAKKGFIAALEEKGYSEKNKTLEVIYKNAQGSIPTLNQEISYLLDQNLELLATNTTLSTISAAQRTHTLPIFMMVSPSPKMAGLLDKDNKPPANLFGVYETLAYIDTSIILIKQLKPEVKTLGAIYSQGEPQSADAFQHLKDRCKVLNIQLISLPVNNSSETQLVVQSLLSKHLDAFFALPDNSVFSSFETILKSCNDAGVPIFTSEEGLVKRGALAAFGADIFDWGHQAGVQAAQYLKTKSLKGMAPEWVLVRKKVYNPEAAVKFHISIPQGISPVK
jgi:putative ABC transport system substrate-binding protein